MGGVSAPTARFELLASALAGRSLTIAPADADEPTWGDGRRIWVHQGGDRAAVREAVIVQAALVAAGSLEPDILVRLVGRPGAARRYLLLEGHRALGALAVLLAGREGLPAITEVAPSAGAAQSLTRALGREVLPDPPASFGVLRPARVLRAHARDQGGAVTPGDQASGPTPEIVPELGEDEESGEVGRLGRAFSSPVASHGPITRLLQRLLGLGRTPGDGPAGGELPIGATRLGERAGPHAVVSTLAVPLGEATERPEPGIAHYPEWDERRGRYRPRWCTVVEVEPTGGQDGPLARHADPMLRRRLARLGVGLEPTRRERQGDDLDLDAVVELEVERQAGDTAGHARVYVDHLRRRRDLGVLVLLDISGSSGETDAAGRSVHAHQREAAAALLDSLEALGDRVAAYGFHSRGRAAVHFVRIKAFDDALDTRTYARLDGLEPGSFTRLGAAVRHATRLLETKAGTPRRLLVVLSDGFAYDHGYEGVGAEADARRALIEAREQGIGCLCLSLGATTEPAALRRVFEPSAFAAAPTFDELGPSLGLLFARALAMSDLRRRLARRGIHVA